MNKTIISLEGASPEVMSRFADALKDESKETLVVNHSMQVVQIKEGQIIEVKHAHFTKEELLQSLKEDEEKSDSTR